jgi:hypothetical protein
LLYNIVIAILKLPPQWKVNPKYVYSFTQSSGLSPKNHLVEIKCRLWDCVPKIRIFGFFRLTCNFHFLLYNSSFWRQYCSPDSDSDIITKSSAYNKQLNSVAPNFTGSQVVLNKLGISLMKRLNNVGLRLHPYFTPTWDWKNGVTPCSSLTADLTEEYMFSKIVTNFLLHPKFISLIKK